MKDGVLEKIECEFPESLRSVDFMDNYIDTVPKLHIKLHKVNLENNCLESMVEYNETITELNVMNNVNLHFTDEEKNEIDEINRKYNCIKIKTDFNNVNSDPNTNLQNMTLQDRMNMFHRMNVFNISRRNTGLGERIIHKNTYDM